MAVGYTSTAGRENVKLELDVGFTGVQRLICRARPEMIR